MQSSVRQVHLGSLGASLERRADGSMLVRSTVPTPPHPGKMTELLEHWARHSPARVFLAKRNDGGAWRHITYAETLSSVRHIAAALLDRDLSHKRPLVILSDNDIEHALLSLAAMYIGIPFSAISPAYSLISSDYGKLKHILALLDPQVVFASDAAKFGKAIAACCSPETEVMATRGAVATHRTTAFASLLDTPVSNSVGAAYAKIGPETIAKVSFTSGSTGVPKGVITTQRMLTSNQAMMRHSWPWQDEALSVCLHKPNVYIDLSGWSPKYFPAELVNRANGQLKHKMLFGSDFPLIAPDRWIKDFQQASFKPEVHELILKQNAIRALKLDDVG